LLSKVSEDVIIQRLVEKLRGVGFEVYTHVVLDGMELDVVAFEYQRRRPVVYVYEVKSRAKSKLLKQISRRADLVDYLYVVVPLNLYPWVLKKLESFVGLVLYMNSDIYIVRKACFLGRGERLLQLLKGVGRVADGVVYGEGSG